MDKYQKYLMETDCYIVCLLDERKIGRPFVGEEINITQDDDITKTNYVLLINSKAIEKVYAVQGEKSEQFDATSAPIHTYKLDFNNKIDSIKIVFNNDLADDLILPVVFHEADKEKYYAQKEQEKIENYIKKANVKAATGADLVNIYFSPCCEQYAKTEIVLYRDNRRMAHYTVEEEIFFKSINGLAYGEYEFMLMQFDKNGKLLFTTEKKKFSVAGWNSY